MIKRYEFLVDEYFKFESGQTVLIGKFIPDLNAFAESARGVICVNNSIIKIINILGEDRFSGGDESKRKNKRAIRTEGDIDAELNLLVNKEARLFLSV